MSKNRRLSTALHILTALAHQTGRLVSSDELATGLRTNPALVRRIVSRLSKAGLVDSQPGKGGGNQLARTADKITLAEVYGAVKDGPLFAGFDKEPLAACRVSCNMGQILDNVYGELEDELVKKMKKIKVGDLVAGVS